MSFTNVFKFLNVRPPQQVSNSERANLFTRNPSESTSVFLAEIKKIASTESEEKYQQCLKKTKEYLDVNFKYLEDIPDFALTIKIAIKVYNSKKKEGKIESYKDPIVSMIEETNAKFELDKKEKVLWDLFYAATLYPTFKPSLREKLYDCLRFIHFSKRVNKGELLNWFDFKNIKIVVPNEMFVKPTPIKRNTEKVKEIQEKIKQELKTVYDQVQAYDKAILEIKNGDKEFSKIEAKKTIKPVTTVSKENRSWFNFKKKSRVRTIFYEIPEPTAWLDSKYAKDNLSNETIRLFEEISINTGKIETYEVISVLESKIYNSIKSFVHSLTPIRKQVVSKEPVFGWLLKRKPIPYFQSVSNFSSNEDISLSAVIALGGSLEITNNVVEPVSPDSALARGIRPVGIGDLKIVRQEFKDYRIGEIAHIENILASELRERKHISERETEETVVVETESMEEQQKDLQTTERFELQKESEKVINNELKVGAGFSVSGSYGPVTAEAHGDFALSMSSSNSEKTASDFAKEVVEKSVSNIMKRAREERTRRTLERFKEINKHAFDNTKNNPKNITGIYRWVDKYYKAQIVNYGKRLMIELIVPEPAAFYKYSQGHLSTKDQNLKMPEPPRLTVLRNLGGPELTEIAIPLNPSDLDGSNYLDLVAQYNIQDVEPYPQQRIRISAGISAETNGGDNYFATVAEKLNVPPGYVCDHIWGTAVMGHDFYPSSGTDYYLNVLVSGMQFFNSGLDEIHERTGLLPISVNGYGSSYNVNLVASCYPSSTRIQQWQLKTYQAIMNAYENALARYNEAIAASQIFNGINIEGKNPDTNRRIEHDELKRAALRLIANDYAVTRVPTVDINGNVTGDYDTLSNEVFDSMQDGSDTEIPSFKMKEAIKEGPIMQFFEQAFEWSNLTYRFYPYFYGREKNWVEAINKVDTDPLFAEFLKAGAARILVPVRQSYQNAVLLYLGTNIIWNGGSVPTLESDLFISIANELKEETDRDFDNLPQCDIDSDSGYPCIEGEPWDVKMPTSLVYLQGDDKLNP